VGFAAELEGAVMAAAGGSLAGASRASGLAG
jgi:hypothetical protein